MPTSRATLAVVVVPLLFACSSTPQPAAQPSVGVTAVEPCNLTGVPANTCIRRGQQRVCHAFVGVAGGKVFVFPPELQSGRGTSGDRERVIVWHLVTPRVVFSRDDGPLELKTHPEFEEGGPTDDFDGAIQNQTEARHYRLGFKNSSVTPNGFKYTIQLRTQDGRVLACDPRITNDGD